MRCHSRNLHPPLIHSDFACFDSSESIDYEETRASPFRGDRMSIISTAVVVLRRLLIPRGVIIVENLDLTSQYKPTLPA